MERRVSFLIVGVFSLFLMAGLILFVLWANHRHGHGRNQTHYVIFFDQGVNGLSIGSGIRYLGVEVGQVTEIDIDPAQPVPRVRVDCGLNPKVPITDGDIATLRPSGITGVSFIDIRHGSEGTPPLTKDANNLTIIPSELSTLDRLLNSGSDSAKKLEEIMDRVNRLLADQNLDHLAHVFDNLDHTTAMLATHDSDLGSSIRDLSQAAASLNAMLAGLRKQGVDRDAAATLRDSRDAADNLSDLTRSLRDNPSKLIFPSKDKGVEIKP
jgi:phospholipid/cholesterol/gamma-HCH transport system substrate-binding protein